MPMSLQGVRMRPEQQVDDWEEEKEKEEKIWKAELEEKEAIQT